jgi:hypothetical protein
LAEAVIPGRERKLANPESSNHPRKLIDTEGYWIPGSPTFGRPE